MSDDDRVVVETHERVSVDVETVEEEHYLCAFCEDQAWPEDEIVPVGVGVDGDDWDHGDYLCRRHAESIFGYDDSDPGFRELAIETVESVPWNTITSACIAVGITIGTVAFATELVVPVIEQNAEAFGAAIESGSDPSSEADTSGGFAQFVFDAFVFVTVLSLMIAATSGVVRSGMR